MSIISKILNNRKIKEYQPISAVQQFNKKYIIECKSVQYECHVSHILYAPVAVILELPKKNDVIFERNIFYNLTTSSSFNASPISMKLCLMQEIQLLQNKVWLFEVTDVSFSLSIIDLFYLKRIYHHSKHKNVNFIENFDFNHYKKLVALFSKPKKVFLVSMINHNNHQNFPIDLCAEFSRYIVIGIRNTNNAAKGLMINSEFFISSVIANKHKEIYSFGKFGSDIAQLDKAADENLPMNLICDYKKVKVVQIIRLEFQTLFCNEILEYQSLKSNQESLYHLHKFWFLHSNNSLQFEFVQP